MMQPIQWWVSQCSLWIDRVHSLWWPTKCPTNRKVSTRRQKMVLTKTLECPWQQVEITAWKVASRTWVNKPLFTINNRRFNSFTKGTRLCSREAPSHPSSTRTTSQRKSSKPWQRVNTQSRRVSRSSVAKAWATNPSIGSVSILGVTPRKDANKVSTCQGQLTI